MKKEVFIKFPDQNTRQIEPSTLDHKKRVPKIDEAVVLKDYVGKKFLHQRYFDNTCSENIRRAISMFAKRLANRSTGL